MDFVYFGQDLQARAPDMFGMLCKAPDAEWVSLLDVVAAMEKGEAVSIRPASAAELQRAEAMIGIRQVGLDLAWRIHQLHDHQGLAVVDEMLTRTREALESVQDPVPLHLLDQ